MSRSLSIAVQKSLPRGGFDQLARDSAQTGPYLVGMAKLLTTTATTTRTIRGRRHAA
jgi:hypothetical protein